MLRGFLTKNINPSITPILFNSLSTIFSPRSSLILFNPQQQPSSSFHELYQKKSPIEHILLRPETYIGNIQPQTDEYYVYDPSSKSIKLENITYIPGLYKIFDEILVNACDNLQRDPTTSEIRVNIDQKTNSIEISNNGHGIPVVLHKIEKVYIPELVMGHLLTGSNFNDSVAKVTGGRNGYGAKLTNIFSSMFKIETTDTRRKKKYSQIWKDNMSQVSDPEIFDIAEDSHDSTTVTFVPDLSRFGIKKINNDMIKLMKRRVYDIAGCNPDISVFLNDQLVPISSFVDYISLYHFNQLEQKSAEKQTPDMDDQSESQNETEEEYEDSSSSGSSGSSEILPGVIFGNPNKRWQIGVAASPSGQFQQISFVNSISTPRGGTHVNYIADQITKYLLSRIKKRFKTLSAVENLTPSQVKTHLGIYVSCLIDNPTFDSQTKEFMSLKPADFGSTCDLSDRFLKQIMDKTNIVEIIVHWAKSKETSNELRKLSLSKSRSKLVNIPKLEDANLAGSSQSEKCTLILTEGDSAKALAIAGLSVVGRNVYGVFPLKGKMLNVRDVSPNIIRNNEEITNLCKSLGLVPGKVYSDLESLEKDLRYGKILLMCDQDHDGSHIKGLFLNLLDKYWTPLLDSDFLYEFVTPIVKAKKGKSSKSFFTLYEFFAWKDKLLQQQKEAEAQGTSTSATPKTTLQALGWKIKYYKGLGTSTSQEGREYFSNLKKHTLKFEPDSELETSRNLINMVFDKSCADDRKNWLLNFDPNFFVDHSQRSLTISDFVNKELIHFSRADNIRSIPSLIDGLKPSQRKVLYASFKKRLDKSSTAEIKVAQLSGFVSENTAYHHGEASLHSTIVGMAQNYPGSNNIELLAPIGQFGTRHSNGKDSASPRYIFTKLNKISRLIFPESDDPLLDYLDEDGYPIEPRTYFPIIPMLLVNGTEGVGTGWSTFIPQYNPVDVIDAISYSLSLLEPEPGVDEDSGFLSKLDSILDKVSKFDTIDVSPKLKSRSRSKSSIPSLLPWYRGFKGVIEVLRDSQGYPTSMRTYGTVHRVAKDVLEVAELPVRKSTIDFKTYISTKCINQKAVRQPKRREVNTNNSSSDSEVITLHNNLLASEKSSPPRISALSEHHTENSVLFQLKMHPRFIQTLPLTESLVNPKKGKSSRLFPIQSFEYDKPGIQMIKWFKLSNTNSLQNMHAFDKNGDIKKFKGPWEIIADFIIPRLTLYSDRIQYLLDTVNSDLILKEHRLKFIRMILTAKFSFSGKNASDLVAELKELGFPSLKKGEKEKVPVESSSSSPSGNENSKQGYEYLLNIPLLSLSHDSCGSLEKDIQQLIEKRTYFENITPHELWKQELATLREALVKQKTF